MRNFYEKNSYAKVNIFLKIAGQKGSYHNIVSRFVKVQNLYDIVRFEKGKFEHFTLQGEFGCDTKQNTIYKAYLKLLEVSNQTKELFKNYKVVVEKNIPEFAGLGGGSSNCATFILMVNEILNLNLSTKQLNQIGQTIGADVPFFLYQYSSANVTGIGENVKYFDEAPLHIKTFTPKIQCNTGKIFKAFRDNYYKEISQTQAQKLLAMKSIDILNSLSIEEANDLYLAAKEIYPQLEPKAYNLPAQTFFTGSGSSFFYLDEKVK